MTRILSHRTHSFEFVSESHCVSSSAVSRSKPSKTFPTRHPSFTSPDVIFGSFGVRRTVEVMPVADVDNGSAVHPILVHGTSRNEIPLCFGASGAVRHRTNIQLAVCPLGVKTFWPLTTHSSPPSTTSTEFVDLSHYRVRCIPAQRSSPLIIREGAVVLFLGAALDNRVSPS